jgi:pyruvate dehydrogenase E2 component (dihydrolipoamide acetyltransferase)
MAVVMEMPRLSDTMREGTIVSWVKGEGETVETGEPIVEIETDKAVMEYEADEGGVIRKILVPGGEAALVGAPICIIAGADEDISAALEDAKARAEAAAAAVDGGGDSAPAEPKPAAKAPKPDKAEAPGDAEEPAAPSPSKSAPAAPPAPQGAPARDAEPGTLVTPVAARLALEGGLDLRRVTGSGPGGRIVKADVLAALDGKAELTPAPADVFGQSAVPAYEDSNASQMRRAIAERLVQSKQAAPHFYLTLSIDMAAALGLREQINASQDRVKVSVNDLIVKAAAVASTRVPEANAAWVTDGGKARVRRFRDVHVGVAVALDDGLVTPVLRNADRRSLVDLALDTRKLAELARARKLEAEAYSGNTVTVSNLGMFGIEQFTAIINPPASIILAVGRAEEVPVVVDGALAVGTRMKVTLSCDHRVVDGAMGARWLQAFKALMEAPLNILV